MHFSWIFCRNEETLSGLLVIDEKWKSILWKKKMNLEDKSHLNFQKNDAGIYQYIKRIQD